MSAARRQKSPNSKHLETSSFSFFTLYERARERESNRERDDDVPFAPMTHKQHSLMFPYSRPTNWERASVQCVWSTRVNECDRIGKECFTKTKQNGSGWTVAGMYLSIEPASSIWISYANVCVCVCVCVRAFWCYCNCSTIRFVLIWFYEEVVVFF